MYESYYGLSEKPFSLTPDPRFLYLSHKHKEAFAHLLYGIRNRNGFVMVSGEIGTGKTTICRSLLKQLDPDTEVAFIFNPYLSPEELLRKINQEFGIVSKAETVRGLIDELNEHLVDQARHDKNCVLIIDEAQNLATQTLEQIRLLSNLETETQKLLQIVLIGQPELPEKLALWELRQLNQRITARYHLEALNEQETLHYIAFRLRVAGGRKKVQFTPRAIKWVYRLSGGTPRVINAICDRALLIGYTKDLRTLTPPVVRQAAREIQGEHSIRTRPINMGRLLPTAGAIAAVAVGVMVVLLFTSGPIPSWGEMTRVARETWTEVTGEADTATDRYQVEAVPEPKLEIAEAASPESAPLITEAATPEPKTSETPTSESPTPEPISPEPTKVAAADDASLSALDEALTDLSDSIPEAEPPGDTPEESTPPGDETKEAIDEAKEAIEPLPTSDPVAEPATEAVEEPPVEKLAKATPKVETEPEPVVEKPSDIASFRASLEALLGAWGKEAMHTRPGFVSDTEVQRVARAHDLAYTALSATPGQIELINLPVVLYLKTDGRKRWVALLKTEGDQYHVHDEAGPGIVPRNEVVNDYQGTAYYFWRDPNPAQESLRAFSEGAAVQEVQDLLYRLGIMKVQANGAYDGRTIEAVTRVQRATGLMADGIVGYKTRMVLWAWTESENTPRLQSPVFPALALESVTGQPGLVITRPAPALNDAPSSLEALEVVEPEEVVATVTDEATEPPTIRLTNDSFNEDPTLVGDFSDAPSQATDSVEPAPESDEPIENYTPVLPEPDSSLPGEVTEISDANIPLRPFEDNAASGSKEDE